MKQFVVLNTAKALLVVISRAVLSFTHIGKEHKRKYRAKRASNYVPLEINLTKDTIEEARVGTGRIVS